MYANGWVLSLNILVIFDFVTVKAVLTTWGHAFLWGIYQRFAFQWRMNGKPTLSSPHPKVRRYRCLKKLVFIICFYMILYHTTLYYTVPDYTAPYYTILNYTKLHFATYTTLHYTTLHYTTPHHITLSQTIYYPTLWH